MTSGLTRLARALVAGWLAVTVVFVMLRLSGDPVLQILDGDLAPDMLERFRQGLGLDRPLWAQYLGYWADLAGGDLGQSVRDGRDVWTVVMEAAPLTALLVASGLPIAMALGLPAGVLAALRRDTVFDRYVVSGAAVLSRVPVFFLAIVLILVLAAPLELLPTGDRADRSGLMLPAATVGICYAAMLARFTRASALDVLRQPFLAASRARGSGGFVTLCRHTLPNAVLPTVSITGLMVGGLIGAATVVETVFGWPGIGHLLVDAAVARDLPVVQGVVLLLAVVMITTNLLVDLLYGWLDPRLRRRRDGGAP